MTQPVLIDTSTLSRYIAPLAGQRSPAVVTRVDDLIRTQGLIISTITVYEIERGLRKMELDGRGAAKRRQWALIMTNARLIGLEQPNLRPLLVAAALYARAAAAKPAIVIDDADLLILATAEAHGMRLLTSDKKLHEQCLRMSLDARVEYVA
jgi:predicted nucleic acid-binding protein